MLEKPSRLAHFCVLSQLREPTERVLKFLGAVIALLATLHLVTAYFITANTRSESLRYISRVFDMNEEISVPTWFSQLILLAAAILAFAIGRVRRSQALKDTVQWFVISALLLFMSIDEGASIHEAGNGVADGLFELKGTWLQYGWVIGGIAVVLAVIIIFFKFWKRLPGRTRWLIFAAAAIFVLGAVGIEMVGGYIISNISDGFAYSVTVFLEESCEMVGVVLAIYAMLDYLGSLTEEITVKFSHDRP